MNLRILLPFGVFCSVASVASVIAETEAGAFGILPHRRDCIASLVPGILIYNTGSGSNYLAADEGVLVKQGADVTVSIRHCIRGVDLAQLHAAVEREFSRTTAQDHAIRQAVIKMESGLVGRFTELRRER